MALLSLHRHYVITALVFVFVADLSQNFAGKGDRGDGRGIIFFLVPGYCMICGLRSPS